MTSEGLLAPGVEVVHLDAGKWMIRRAESPFGACELIGFIHTHHGMHEALCVGATPTPVYAPTFDCALQLVITSDGVTDPAAARAGAPG
ncbi:hypothetical protein [Subtercola boreus]|uniref:hypothetical protein n=1 Tax=Subtercola boreus TaxID=120213 RepID=UPI0011C07467|nr:hypothetical protein [Subtercola boreus]